METAEANRQSIHCRLSFIPLLEYYQDLVEHGTYAQRQTLGFVLEQLRQVPELWADNIPWRVVEQHADLIALMLSPAAGGVANPVGLQAVMKPFDDRFIHVSDDFRRYFLNDHKAWDVPSVQWETIDYNRVLHAYMIIFHRFYHVHWQEGNAMTFKVYDDEKKLNRYFRIRINARFLRVRCKGELPSLEQAGISASTVGIGDADLALWQQHLPLDLFEFEGLAIIDMEDVTTDSAISELKTILLQDEGAYIERVVALTSHIRNILGVSDMKVGIAAFLQFEHRYLFTEEHQLKSFIIREHCEGPDTEDACIRQALQQYSSPQVYSDVQAHLEHCHAMRSSWEKGFQSVILYPLRYGDEFLGVLELASRDVNALDHMMLPRLEIIAPFLSMALKRKAAGLVSQVRDVIQEKYTAIQPVVAWKFNQLALQYIQRYRMGQEWTLPPVVFKDVYPLYAAVDIRNSSVERRKAIQQDLSEQLAQVQALLKRALQFQDILVLEKYQHKVQALLAQPSFQEFSEDEAHARDFFRNEVEPILRHLAEHIPLMKREVDDYFSRLHRKLRVFHAHRDDFEHTLTAINEALNRHLEQQQREAQIIFPHYFEKYKTDGVEYNIYIGQSLVPYRSFHPIYLKNLRLWHLKTLCEMAQLTERMLPDMELPLRTTQLLLSYSMSLSISFRQDERKFDVDGAYNIRYEIVKKRIDKARIKGSEERLTQPGKVAIVYTQSKDAAEYQDYIDFLVAKGLLHPEVEYLELEELQGVSGLRAMRVAICL